MNDRLGDLGKIPSWAVEEDGSHGIETSFAENIQSSHSNEKSTISSCVITDSADDFPTIELTRKKDTKAFVIKKYMAGFFRDMDTIKVEIEEIERVTRRIGEINDESMLAISEAKEDALSQEVRPMVSETNKKAKRTKNFLSALKEEKKRLTAKGTLKDSDMRVRENLCNTVTRKFIDVMKLYQAAQVKYKTDIKKKAERQILLIKEDATPEEIETIMKSGGRERLLQQHFLAGGLNDQVKETYTRVAGRYQDILRLEDSVMELHQMFIDIELLTELQSEQIDQIEFNVVESAKKIEDANENLYHAIKNSRRSRKRKCLVIIIVVVLTVVALSFIL